SETPEGERTFIIAHERHHIRRHDPLWKLLGYCALCLHWFNPLVWLAFCLAGKDMEMSCDEAVIKRLGEHIRADYSQALLRLATHKRIVSGMPLAFGEGDTKGRVMNMAKWKKPKVWVSVLCVALCLVILAACALNPKQEETETDGETQIVGPARIVIRDLRFRIPAGCITEKMEKKIHEQTDDGLDVAYWEFADGESIIGGVNTFRIPEDFSADNWDWLHELDLPEWQDETLGYSAGGAPVDKVIVEFFSDVPDGQERTVLNEHNLYFYEGWIYDLWFDKLTVKPEVMKAILDSVSVGVKKTIPVVDMPYKILEMPAGGYDYRVESDGSISFLKGDNIIGGIVAYPIPEGVYDPYDDAYLWLEDVGIPDLEDPNLYVAGVFSWKGSSSCSLTVEDDFQNPTVKRTHYFQIAGDMLYDFWLDEMQLDEDTQSAIQNAVVYQESAALQSGAALESEMSEEEKAFSKSQAVMMGLQDIPILIQTECRYQNTPEKNYIETFCDDSEIGFLRVTTTADGLDHAQLYVNDRYYTNAGSETNPEPIWVESEAPSEFSSPWLGNFNFIRHYVTYVDTLSDTEKTSYLFRVDAPFEDREDATPYYFVSFDFDSEGNFLSVYLQINPAQDNAYTLTESIVSTDEQAIVTKIDQEYQRAIG
ncbi:MAG: M56 family metallopeptidase, partial [Candidatus Faecousia sp.]|nr:M56 family metallopeptidase [Candidatus Faecousia sp.]